MKKKLPKLSIVVPVYNTANYIEKCLDSLLNQEYSNIELIVMEDNSTDNSRDILMILIKDYHIQETKD